MAHHRSAPRVVAELNSATEDARPAIRKDGLEVILHSRRPPALGRDLWVSTRATVLDPWSSPIQVTTVNGSDNDLQANLSDDGETLFFSSNRSGVGAGEKLTLLRRLRTDPLSRWRRRPGSW
jgi:hypothetical protein